MSKTCITRTGESTSATPVDSPAQHPADRPTPRPAQQVHDGLPDERVRANPLRSDLPHRPGPRGARYPDPVGVGVVVAGAAPTGSLCSGCCTPPSARQLAPVEARHLLSLIARCGLRLGALTVAYRDSGSLHVCRTKGSASGSPKPIAKLEVPHDENDTAHQPKNAPNGGADNTRSPSTSVSLTAAVTPPGPLAACPERRNPGLAARAAGGPPPARGLASITER